MRFKVYFLIFLGFLLTTGISSAGKLIGERLKVIASEEIIDTVNNGSNGKLESDQVIDNSSDKIPGSLKVINRDISKKYSWYFIASFIVQTVLIASVIVVLGNLIIKTVKRGVLL